MAFKIVALTLPRDRLVEAEALLELSGALSLTLVDAGSEEILEPEPGSTPLWASTRVRALFRDDVDVARIVEWLDRTLGRDVAVEVDRLLDDDWIDALTAEPPRLPVGARLMITAARDDAPVSNRTVVRLNRGLGFGTGEHPTTRLCLEWLDDELVPGMTVVDYGCGSGILSVAALALGAAQAWAVDIEPQAVEAAAANAALNGVADRFWAGPPAQLPAHCADVVIANILAGTLIELAPALARLVGPGGTLVLAGILAAQAAAVSSTYCAHFSSLSPRERDGWVCLVARDRRRTAAR